MIYKIFYNYFSAVFSLAIFAALLASNPTHTLASGSHLDNTFDGNGKLVATISSGDDVAHDVAIQADGKIVVVGGSAGGAENSVARFNPNGSLDTTFGVGGKVSIAIGNPCGNTCGAQSVAIQSNGKIVVAGSSSGLFGASIFIFRLNPDGSMDITFGVNGIRQLPNIYRVTSVVIQPDGKIVAVGTDSTFIDWFICRITVNGELDATFGDGGGTTYTDFGGDQEIAQAVSVLPNGKILVAGIANPGNQDFALALYTTNGTLDTSFDGDGKVTTDFIGRNDFVRSMKLQSDGKIVLAGGTSTLLVDSFALARYNANGSLDTTFDNDGKVVKSVVQGDSSANDVAIQLDGKIVAVGTDGGNDFVAVRFNPNGSTDSSFGRIGVLHTDINTDSEDFVNAITVQADGKLVVVGTSKNNVANATFDFAVARYLPNFGNSVFDFDGDGKTDIGIFRPAPAEWWIYRSSTTATFATQFGQTSDRITPADFTGDGKADVALWRPSNGFWFVLRSEDLTFFSFPFGASGDIPAPSDYDGDGKADAAVFRPSSSTWFISKSSGGTTIQQFGQAGDLPVTADYDGDGKSDIAIFRQNGAIGAEWWIFRSSTNSVFATQFGTSTDKAVQGDYTGDGKADIAVWRPANGNWFVLRSEDFSFFAFPFGANGDTPVAGDYDGDGKFDASVFRPTNSTWYVQRTTAGTLIQQFGIAGDKPIPNAFVP